MRIAASLLRADCRSKAVCSDLRTISEALAVGLLIPTALWAKGVIWLITSRGAFGNPLIEQEKKRSLDSATDRRPHEPSYLGESL